MKWLLLNALFAVLGFTWMQPAAAAEPTTSEDIFASICAGSSLPVEGSEFPVNPGLLWNRERSGTGWTLAYAPVGLGLEANQRVSLVWYTYRPSDGTPVWYLSDPKPIGPTHNSPLTFESPLYEYSWNASADAGSRVRKGDNSIGTVKGYFALTDQRRLALRWMLGNDPQ